MNQHLKLTSEPQYMTEIFSYDLCCSCFNADSISFAPLGPLEMIYIQNYWNTFNGVKVKWKSNRTRGRMQIGHKKHISFLFLTGSTGK